MKRQAGSLERRPFLAKVAAAALALSCAPVRARTLSLLTDAPGRPERLLARLAELGHVEGRSLRFEVRRVHAGASPAELSQAAREMVASAPDALLSSGVLFMRALANATSRIPIVCAGVSNPVGLGFAKSLARPGGNITGLSYGLPEAAELQLGTLRELCPALKRVTFVVAHPRQELAPEHLEAARKLGLQLRTAGAEAMADVDAAFSRMEPAADAAWIGELTRRIVVKDLADAATRYRIATHAKQADDVRSGLLFSYWLGHSDLGRRLALVIDKVLRGMDPAGIPFDLPDRADLVLNRATADAIGVRFSPGLVLRASEVV